MATRKKAAAPAEPTPQETPEAAAPAAETIDMPFDKMVRIYRKIGEKVTETKATYEAILEELQAQQDVLKDAIREHMKKENATSINTPYGLAIMSKSMRYGTNDWDGFKTFVRDNDLLDLFEKRLLEQDVFVVHSF